MGDSSHKHDHWSHLGSAGLAWALTLNLLLTAVELVLGLVSGSLALLADALHNFNDCLALIVAVVARRVSRLDADERFTFGYRRAELIGALMNQTALMLVGLYLLYHAAGRIVQPEPVQGGLVMIAAGVALTVDMGTVVLVQAMTRRSGGGLNIKTVLVHNLADAAGSLAVLLGGAAILIWGWMLIDPLLTLVIAGYLIWQGVRLLRHTAAILMEARPPGVDLDSLAEDLGRLDGVVGVHHLHVWQLDEDHRALEVHLVIPRADSDELDRIKTAAKAMLRARHHVGHSTLEFEFPTANQAGSG